MEFLLSTKHKADHSLGHNIHDLYLPVTFELKYLVWVFNYRHDHDFYEVIKKLASLFLKPICSLNILIYTFVITVIT